MNLKRVYAIFLRQVYLVRGTATRFIQIFIWITVDITLWGFTTKYLTGTAGGEFNFVPMLLGAVLLWDFSTNVMQGVTMLFFEDVWSRNFLNIFASPLKISEYVGGLILSGVARSILALLVMFLLAIFAFGFSVFTFGVSLAGFLLILFFFGIALGIIGVSIVLRLGPAAEWLVWPIPALLSPFVGVLYSLSVLPGWMQFIGQFLPPSYVFAGIREIVNGGTFPVSTFLWGLLMAFIYIILAYIIFVNVYRKAVRTGLIARYSAETVT